MQPGHTDLTCNNKPVCGHCAGEHITNNCSSTQLPPKCALGCKEPHKGTDKDCPVWRTHVVRLAATQRQQYTQQKQANTQKSQQEQIIRSYSAAVTTANTETAQKITTEVTQQINTQKQQIEQVETKLEGGLKTLQDRITTCIQTATQQIIDTLTNTFSGLLSQIQCFAEKLATLTTTITAIPQSPTPILAPEISQQITVLTKALSAATSCLDEKPTPSGPPRRCLSKERPSSGLPAPNPQGRKTKL